MRAAAGVSVILVASSAALGNGQFLAPRAVVGSFSSSWSSSSSWLPGRDGQLHQQVREVRTETLRDGGLAVKSTESRTACRDGLCQQTVSIEKPGSITVMSQGTPAAESRWPQALRLPARLRGLLHGLIAAPVVVRIGEHTEPAGVKFLAPRPLPVDEALPLVEADAPNPPEKVPPHAAAAAPGLEGIAGPYLVAPLAALAGTGTLLLGLIVAAAAKCQQRSSREVPLRSLGEPLAPAQEAAAAPRRAHGPPPATPAQAVPKEAEAPAEGEPVRAYLQSVYTRALMEAQAAAANAYLYRVYVRAAA